MAASYHQLGWLAQQRGDYDAAQASIVTTYSNLGNLLLELLLAQHLPKDALLCDARALVVRQRLGIPQVGYNVASLRLAHQELGDARTLALLNEAVGSEAGRQILDGLTALTSDNGATPEAQ
jgi:hypothetical protein